MEITRVGPLSVTATSNIADAYFLGASNAQQVPRQQLTDREKKTAVFRYIREHLDGNEQAIWELGEQCRQFGQQQQNNNQHVQQQLQQTE
jgi:hypothetical protein